MNSLARDILFVFIAAGFLLSATPASSTSYSYQGSSLDWSCSGTCSTPLASAISSFQSTLFANVIFNFDTSNTSGTFSLFLPDQATTPNVFNSVSFGGDVPEMIRPGGAYSYYPGDQYGGYGLGAFGISFTLTLGMITSWTLDATSGGGRESIATFSFPGGDGISITACGTSDDCSVYDASAVPGNWSGPTRDEFSTSAVPEPSTWAMLLIGFAGVGFMTCRPTRVRQSLMIAARVSARRWHKLRLSGELVRVIDKLPEGVRMRFTD